MYTASEDGLVKIWDMRAKGAQKEYNAHSAVINALIDIAPWDEHGKDSNTESLPFLRDMVD